MTELERINTALAACRELPPRAPKAVKYSSMVGQDAMDTLEAIYRRDVSRICQLLMHWQQILGLN